MNWYLAVLKKYATISGRATRSEYWYFVLFNALITIALIVLDKVTGTYNADVGLGAVSGLYSLAVLIPSVAVAIRRLHDTGRSGWWFLLAFIPLVGALILLFFMVQDSQAMTNKYGENPKASPALGSGIGSGSGLV